jgi:hypothetical protein
MRGVGSPAVGRQRPLDGIFGEAVLESGAGMVEDDAVRLAWRWPKSAADHLPKQAHALRRRAKTMQLTAGMSTPSVKTAQLQITSISPRVSLARMASRSSFGVLPSM